MGNYYPPSGGNNRYPSSPNRYPPAGGNNRYPGSPNRYPSRSPLPPGSPVLWYAAWDIDGSLNSTLTDADPIGTWVNKGSLGSSADLTQATAANRPTYDAADSQIGGSAVVTFDGGDFIQSGNFTSQAQDLTFVFAWKATLTAPMALCDGNDATNRVVVYYGGGAPNILNIFAGANGGGLTPVPAANQYHRSISFASGASSHVNLNGTQTNYGTDIGTNALDGFTLGAFYTGVSNNLNGAIAECFVYQGTPPSDADIIAYLDDLYGSTWPKT